MRGCGCAAPGKSRAQSASDPCAGRGCKRQLMSACILVAIGRGLRVVMDADAEDAAIDAEQMDGDTARGIGGTKHRGTGKLVELAAAAQWRAQEEFFAAVRAVKK